MKRQIDLFNSRQYMLKPDYELYHYSDKDNLHVIPHTHDFYEINYLLSERRDIIIENQEYHMKSGDFLLVPPGLMHYPARFEVAEGKSYERILFWCSLSLFKSFSDLDPELNNIWDAVRTNKSYHVRPSVSSSHILNSLFYRLLDEQSQRGPSASTMIRSLLGEIFVQINRIVYGLPHFQRSTLVVTLFNNILYYIHTHLSDDLSLESIAGRFFVSKGYVSRVFKEYLNVSVHQYVLSLRLEGVKNAILNGMPITKASEAFRFTDYSSFYRAFKKAYEVSPQKYFEIYKSSH